MNKTPMHWPVICQLSVKNSVRWRWRLATIALLVALSFSLHVLYGAYLTGISSSGQAAVKPLETRYYDAMVVLTESQHVIEREDLPATMFRRSLYGYAEAAQALLVDSDAGGLELLGLPSKSAFFSFPDTAVTGKAVAEPGEVLLPKEMAEMVGLNIGDTITLSALQNPKRSFLTVELVGIYNDDFDLAPALCHVSDVVRLRGVEESNRYLINYNRNTEELNDPMALQYLVDWMQVAYPGATILSDVTPTGMATALLTRILSPGNGLLLLIFAFAGIGTLTVAFMTFLERRREIAALKSVGLSNNQMMALLSLEYLYAAAAGLACGLLIVGGMFFRFPWLQAVGTHLSGLAIQGALSACIIMVVALVFPVATACVATVNQLLYARTIPLYTVRTNHMTTPEGWLVLLEQQENLRILRFPTSVEQEDFMCYKSQGDTVKRGEVVASMESMGGLQIHEWAAWCDGIVTDSGEHTHIFIIAPLEEDVPFYPYPQSLIEEEVKRSEVIERAREAVRRERKDAER